MMIMWTLFYVGGKIPELATKPAEIYMHLIAEFTTALLLVLAGFGLLKSKKWAEILHPFSLGMLLYTLIVSPGYYIQKNNASMVIMFSVLGIFTLFFIGQLFLRENNVFRLWDKD